MKRHLIREFKEELDIDLTSVTFLEKSVDHQAGKEIEIILLPLFCRSEA